MWLVIFDTEYYPDILIFKTYLEAKKEYDYMLNNIGKEDALYITQANDYILGNNYMERKDNQ